MRLAISPICHTCAHGRDHYAAPGCCVRAQAHLVPLEPILGLKRAAVLLLELPQLVVDIKGAAKVWLPQPLAKLRQVAKAVEELLATLLEGLVLCHGGHRSLRRGCYATNCTERKCGVAAPSIVPDRQTTGVQGSEKRTALRLQTRSERAPNLKGRMKHQV